MMNRFVFWVRGALSLYLACALCSNLLASDGWTEDYQAALQKAKTENKVLLLDFTGSDWCGWCIKLDKEVFSKPEFKKYADQNLVPVTVDFPKKKTQSPATKKQNDALAAKHGISGYPTIIVLDKNEKVIGKLGYMPGGPAAFIAELERIKPRKAAESKTINVR